MNKNFVKISKLGELCKYLNSVKLMRKKIIAEIYLSFIMPE